MSEYYKRFNRKAERPLCPSKEEYEAYIHPTKINKKTGLRVKKEVREMTIKEQTYHNWMYNYWIRNIQPYLCERE